ncbi:MAG: hypothetical protein ACYTE3_29510 [Planctomycetota bacterium]|jgi:hypothetical protein
MDFMQRGVIRTLREVWRLTRKPYIRCLADGDMMGFLDIFRKKKEDLPPEGSGILAVLFGDGAELDSQFEEDVSIYRATGQTVPSYKVSSVAEIRNLLSSRKPALFHLHAVFTEHGSLVDSSNNELALEELMKLAEASGVRLFIVGNENKFDYITDHIYKSPIMNFLTILTRNRHFPAFLNGIIDGLSKDPNFALAYVNLAPQDESAQEGLPLPASIAICPHRKYGTIVLWSNAQP